MSPGLMGPLRAGQCGVTLGSVGRGVPGHVLAVAITSGAPLAFVHMEAGVTFLYAGYRREWVTQRCRRRLGTGRARRRPSLQPSVGALRSRPVVIYHPLPPRRVANADQGVLAARFLGPPTLTAIAGCSKNPSSPPLISPNEFGHQF